MDISKTRRRVAVELDPKMRMVPGLSFINMIIIVLIIVSLLVGVIETEPEIYEGREFWFKIAESTFFVIFLIEYLGRIWACIENPTYKNRLHYILKPASLFDLLALIAIIFTLMDVSGFLLRLARMLRILRLARLGRFSGAMTLLGDAVSKRKFELVISGGAAFVLLFISSTFLYLAEGGVQSDNFGSIPRAMWWSVATLTTVGYGDVYPVTVIGKICAGFTAVAGIGLIAMPTGILASAVSDAIQEARVGKEI